MKSVQGCLAPWEDDDKNEHCSDNENAGVAMSIKVTTGRAGMRRIQVMMFSAALILMSGCKDDGVSVDDRDAGLYGTIVSQGGGAIAGAGIHYIFYTQSNPVTLNALIQYSLPTTQTVTLKIFDPLDRQVATVIDGVQQPAGVHSVFVSDSSFTNGVYSYMLQTGDSMRTGSFYIRDDDIGRLQCKELP
jgi:hypothetical protein